MSYPYKPFLFYLYYQQFALVTGPLLGAEKLFVLVFLCVFSLTRERNALFTGPGYKALTYKDAACSQQPAFSSVLEPFPLYGQDTDHDDSTLQPRKLQSQYCLGKLAVVSQELGFAH